MSHHGHGARASRGGQNGVNQAAVEATIGGYRYEFITEPPDYLRCTLCRLPSRDPYLSDCCGNIFCSSCLQASFQGGSKSPASHSQGCPNPKCQNPRAFTTFRNKQVDRNVKEMKVYCPNKHKGCSWQDKVNEVPAHLTRNCQHEDVECTNQCGQMVQRQHFSRHISNECQFRTAKCKYCRTEGQHVYILGQHKQTCPKYPVPCPNGCKVTDLLQENLPAHRQVCLLEPVPCEYFKEGCTEKVPRQNQAKHNKEYMERHLTLTKCELIKIRKRENDIQDLIALKNEVGQKLEGIKQDLTIKLDIELSNVKREIAAIRSDVGKGPSNNSNYRHW